MRERSVRISRRLSYVLAVFLLETGGMGWYRCVFMVLSIRFTTVIKIMRKQHFQYRYRTVIRTICYGALFCRKTIALQPGQDIRDRTLRRRQQTRIAVDSRDTTAVTENQNRRSVTLGQLRQDRLDIRTQGFHDWPAMTKSRDWRAGTEKPGQ
jgi:hypothetical protein